MVWIRPPRSRWQNFNGTKIQDPVVPLGRNVYGHQLAGLLWERRFEKSSETMEWEKVQAGNGYFYAPSARTVSVRVCGPYQHGRKEKQSKTLWERLMKQTDPVEPTHSLDQVFLECTQREWKPIPKDYRTAPKTYLNL